MNLRDSNSRVLVNVSHPPRDPDIYLPPQLSRAVKRHQIEGIRFFYDNIVESIDKYKSTEGSGCILSHAMGLGKTLQTIAFIDVLLNESRLKAKHVICVVPVNTLQNWLIEFSTWIPKRPNHSNVSDIRYRTFCLFSIDEIEKGFESRSKIISSWRRCGGVLLIGYEMFRILTDTEDITEDITDDNTNNKRNEIKSHLLRPDLLVCDEGHRIKNPYALISIALKKVETKRRIVLTGYPIQNNLLEYWCMTDFVRPNHLGSYANFRTVFEKPIKDGQLKDSTDEEKREMRIKSYVLYTKLEAFVQRRCHSVLKDILPPKTEYVIMCGMTEIQKDLMKTFINLALNDPHSLGIVKISFFVAFAVCFKIWNHPDIVFDIYSETCTGSDDEVYEDRVLNYQWCERVLKKYKSSGNPYKMGRINHSNKMLVLFEIIDQTISCGDKLIVFSQSLFTLNLIEKFMKSVNIPKRRTKWSRDVNYYRLDGSTQTRKREQYIERFNTDQSVLLFLISTKAGSLGINLIGANRVVIFDANWNPCHDEQAACRIYRYGQKKECFIYRLICDNSLERIIFNKQINKHELADRVVDEKNVEPNFTGDDIRVELSKLLSSEPPIVQHFTEADISSFSDRIIRHIMTNNSDLITQKPFKHESLLLDRKETQLTDEEKRKADLQCNQNKSVIIDKKLKHCENIDNITAKLPQSSQTGLESGNSMRILNDSTQESVGFDSFTESLVGKNYSMTRSTLSDDILININRNNSIVLKKGDKIAVISTKNGYYVKLSNGQIISITDSNVLSELLSKSMPEQGSTDKNSNRVNTTDSLQENDIKMPVRSDCMAKTNPSNQTIVNDPTHTSNSRSNHLSEDRIQVSINGLDGLSIRSGPKIKTSTPIPKNSLSSKILSRSSSESCSECSSMSSESSLE